jgi:hypothetical protein
MTRRRRPKPPSAEIVRINKVLPRLELATALEMAGGEDELALAKLLRSNGDSKRRTISGLAMDLGVPYRRVVECYRDMKRLEGVVAVAMRLPKVMEDVAADAESKEVTCPACFGEGRITVEAAAPAKDDQPAREAVTRVCIPCEGLGRVVKPGDAAARKQVLDIMELTGKAPIWAPGSNILATGESLEDTLRAVRRGKEGANGTGSDQRGSQGNQQDPRTIDASDGKDPSRTV